MISIRECVDSADLEYYKEQHILFVSLEVNKRIDFYLNLFQTIEYLQLHNRTQLQTIKDKVQKYIHHKQYTPFIKVLFLDGKFNKNGYNNLKKLNLFRAEAVNYTLVIQKLLSLRKRTETIVGLDLSYNRASRKRYYELLKIEFLAINFLLNTIFDYDWFLNRNSDDTWGAYQLTGALYLKVCSYCNRQYTFTLSKGEIR